MTPNDVITDVSCSERTIALPQPLRLGPALITERYYTVVHVRCASGITGAAFAQTRGAPVATIIDRLLSKALIDRAANQIQDRWNDMFRATIAVGRVGLVMRAISLLDLALWDAQGLRSDTPVAELLSPQTARTDVPVIYVAGYPGDRREIDEVAWAAIAAAQRGHETVKIARTPSDPSVTRDLLKRLQHELPDRGGVVVDVNWGWRTVAEALDEIRQWPPEVVTWIEDPFPPEDALMIAELRRQGPLPVAAGDDLTDPVHATRLLTHDAVDVLRVDVAAIGGITGAEPVIRAAQAAGIPVSFHISPESSIHLAAAHDVVQNIETFDRAGNRLDPSHELVIGGPAFAGGAAQLSDQPGLGFTITD